jgi:hypothetical protein
MIRLLVAVSLLIAAPVAARADGHGLGQSLGRGDVLRGAFVQQRLLKGFDAPLRSEGHFVLAAGRGLIWRVEKPFAITTVITSAGLVQQAGGSETMRLASARLPFLSHLYDMLGGALSGDWRALEADFSAARSGGADHWQVRLTPRKTDDPIAMPFSAIAATGGRFVETVQMSKPDGDSDTLTFAEQVLNGAPLDSGEIAALGSLGK